MSHNIRRVFVTGGRGFVGQALLTVLRSRHIGYRYSVRTREQATEALASPLDLERQEEDWAPVLKGADAVVHLAARVHVARDHSPDPHTAFQRINRDATLKLARAAEQAGVSRFVFLSTIGVYGRQNSQVGPGCDVSPDSPYAHSKLQAEQGLAKIAARGNLGVTVFRAPLVYGPGCPGNLLRLMKLIWYRAPLPFASIENRRSLIAVESLADLLTRGTLGSDAVGHTFSVADIDTSTPELIRTLAAGMDRAPVLFAAPTGLLERAARFVGAESSARQILGSLVVQDPSVADILGWQRPNTSSERLWITGRSYGASKRRQGAGPLR